MEVDTVESESISTVDDLTLVKTYESQMREVEEAYM